MKVVVLGGGYAGIICALRLARGGAEVTLVNASDQFVERIRLHEAAVGRGPRARSVARFLEGTGISLLIGRAVRVDGKTVELDDGREIAFEHLVLALGSRFETREGTVSLGARLPKAGQVLVVGGGLTGIEAASEIAEARPELRVTLVTRGAVGAGFTEAARAHVRRVFSRRDITLLENTDYESVNANFDMTIWAGGFLGAKLPAGLEVKTNARGQVMVEPTMRALGTDSIWVCGDLAAQAFPPAIPVPMGCKAAGPTAARVADNILAVEKNAELRPLDYVAPGFCVSLGRRDGFVELANGRVVTGRAAAWIKELICKATLWAFSLERYGLINYARFGAGNVRVLPGAGAGAGAATAS